MAEVVKILEETDMFILHIQYYGCRWLCDDRTQDISSHGIDLVHIIQKHGYWFLINNFLQHFLLFPQELLLFQNIPWHRKTIKFTSVYFNIPKKQLVPTTGVCLIINLHQSIHQLHNNWWMSAWNSIVVKLLCIIMFDISKIRPKFILGPVKAQKFSKCLLLIPSPKNHRNRLSILIWKNYTFKCCEAFNKMKTKISSVLFTVK